MQILITGARGQLGHDVAQAAIDHGYATLALPRNRLDITETDSVNQAIGSSQPDLVVNCAAYTAVDRAEQEQRRAFAVNRDGPANLAVACARRSIPLIHISTDYVFDGEKKTPYAETDPVHPINVYGLSKAAGEEEVQQKSDRFIILRTAWVFGIHGRNFVQTMLRLGQERQTIRVVADQFGCPTYTGSLADAVMAIAERCCRRADPPWGIYHYAGQPPVNWHGLAQYVFSTAHDMGLPLKVRHLEAIPSRDYPLPARRAANSRLDGRKFKRVFGMEAASWQDGVQAVVAHWCKMHVTGG